ncbi:T-complex protein 11 homolog [Sceloporus undulatus]|uniref:T-complex protein 11 homolog n=1 Tax=Sceloporus undulatus TaxID=8520 RepID=UPI001C4D1B45|nr:T-complex protein 11 homolog [Sceloporus undulatus]
MPNTKETTSSDWNDSQNADCNPRKAKEHEDIHGGEMPDLCPPDIPPSSPPQFFSTAELMETANEVSKMTIAHEIVVNQDFKLQEVNFPPNSLESRVKETLHKAFWDNLREQLSKIPPDYAHAIKLLQEIKEILLSLLLPRQTRLQSQIEEALDMELIKQEAEHGALDIANLTTYILGTMAMLCAPVRDEEIQRLRVMTDPVHLLREIFRVLDLMKMDMVNFTIQTLRPHLQEHSVQYERKKFQELLSKLPAGLAFTTEWLRKAAAAVSTSDVQLSSSTSETNGSPVPTSPEAAGEVLSIHSPTAVLNQAYMDLLHWDPGKDYPETMMMDKARLHALQMEVNQLAIIAAVLLVSNSTCGNGAFSSAGCGDRLKLVTKALLEGHPGARLEDALLDISSQIHQEVNRTLLQLGYPALTADKATLLKGQLRSLADKDNAVRNLIEQRIETFLRHCLSHGGKNSASLLQGLAPIQEELLEVGRRFSSLIHYNRQVFGPYYSGILKKLLLQEEKSGTAS